MIKAGCYTRYYLGFRNLGVPYLKGHRFSSTIPRFSGFFSSRFEFGDNNTQAFSVMFLNSMSDRHMICSAHIIKVLVTDK